jgi:hypothetical protein
MRCCHTARCNKGIVQPDLCVVKFFTTKIIHLCYLKEKRLRGSLFVMCVQCELDSELV